MAGLGSQEGGLELVHIGNGGRDDTGVPEEFSASGVEDIPFGQQDEGEPGKMLQGQGRISRLGKGAGLDGEIWKCRLLEFRILNQGTGSRQDDVFLADFLILGVPAVMVVYADDKISPSILEKGHQFSGRAFQTMDPAAGRLGLYKGVRQLGKHIGTEKSGTGNGQGIA